MCLARRWVWVVVFVSTVAVCRCVMGIASNRHRRLGCRSRSGAGRGHGSVRRARRPMCGRGRCARIPRSAGIFGHDFSPAPGCITRCWASSSGALPRGESRSRVGDRVAGCRVGHPAQRQGRRAAFRAVEQARGFGVDAAQSFASGLRTSWVREHLRAQEVRVPDAPHGRLRGVRGLAEVQAWPSSPAHPGHDATRCVGCVDSLAPRPRGP